MLHDVIKNQLTVISLNARLSKGDTMRIARIQASIDEMVVVLDGISEESLQQWWSHYENLTRH